MDRRVHPARGVQGSGKLATATVKWPVLKIGAAGKGRDSALEPIIGPVKDWFAQSLQIALDHFSTGAFCFCLCRNATIFPCWLSPFIYMWLLTLSIVVLGRLDVPGSFYVEVCPINNVKIDRV
jgi:hypothetical protein